MTDQSDLLSKEEMNRAAESCRDILAALDAVIVGKPELTRMATAAMLAGGHILFEGLPGLGKTVLAKSTASVLGMSFGRVQFTPDLLPSDITGSYILEESESGRQMRFYPGPVFNQLLLADEINRASPKTQSALLEAMSERQVTQMGEKMNLGKPFCVLATQNPIEMEGTYPLPEAQLDRFAVKLDVLSPEKEDMKRIITEQKVVGNPTEPSRVLSAEDFCGLQELVDAVYLPESVSDHIATAVAVSHPDHPDAPEQVRDCLKYGASPRAAIWLVRLARALALIEGRPSVGFEHVSSVAPAVMGHRLILDHGARIEGYTGRGLAEGIVKQSEDKVLQQ